MKTFFSICILLFPVICFSQKATFIADLKSHPLYKYHNYNNNVETRYENEYWVIRGDTLNYGDTLQVHITPHKMDTIFYKHYRSDVYIQPILVNIKNPFSYTFGINTCCPTFMSRLNNDTVNLNHSVSFSMTTPTTDTIMGIVGNAD